MYIKQGALQDLSNLEIYQDTHNMSESEESF